MVQLSDISVALAYVTLAASLAVGVSHAARLHMEKMLAWLGAAAFTGASLAAAYSSFALGEPVVLHGGHVVHDQYTSLILLASAAAAVLALLAAGSKPEEWPSSPGFYGLLPIILFGVYYLAGSSTPAMVLASWMVLSVATYVAAALPGEPDSRMAAARYIYVGTLATLVLALWVAALYSGAFLAAPAGLALAFAGFLAALGFKTGAFPFHWWLPSVYGRANGLATALIAGVAKPAFIIVLAKAALGLAMAAPAAAPMLALLIAAIAVATMTYGNIAALTTRGLRAMLSYSSIAQTGYILVGLAAAVYFVGAGGPVTLALAGIVLQAAAYALAKAPLFALAAESEEPALKGYPAAAAATLLASLLGVPILIGFWGKLYLFLPAAQYSLALVAIALVNSGVSSAYYVRFLRDALQGSQEPSVNVKAALLLAALLSIAAGLAAPVIAGALAG